MRGRLVAVATAAACLAVSASAGAATYGFESPDIPTGSWNNFGSIPYWTPTNSCGIEVQDHVAGNPFEGGQFVELNSHCRSGITHSFTNSNALESVDVTFRFSPRPYTQAEDNAMQVLFDGNIVTLRRPGTNDWLQTVGPVAGGTTTQWTAYEFRTANVAPGTHTLTFRSVGTNPSGGGVGTYLDNVQLSLLTATSSSGAWGARCDQYQCY